MCITTKSLNNITPYEVYHQQKPDISHLREIGCRAFVLILNKHNPKIFQRSEEHILIGYGKDSKTYRCYHRPMHKVIESYHVTFIESKDKYEIPFRPGVTQGLDDESIQPLPTFPLPPALPSQVSTPMQATTPPLPIPPADPAPPPATAVNFHSRRSSRIPQLSTRSAEASGIQHISAIQ